MNTTEDVTHFLETDVELMRLLTIVASLGLPDWWICAGYVRAKIWDDAHGYEVPTPAFANDSSHHHIYRARINKKNWQATWPRLHEVDIPRQER
nr:nucleotidyltransferase family protein [Exiguobacterium sp. s150]